MHRLRWGDDRVCLQEFVCETLMIAFGVIVSHEVGDRVLKRCLPEEDHSIQTLRLYRAYEALGKSIRVGCQLQLVLNLARQLPSRSRTPFIPGVERSLFS